MSKINTYSLDYLKSLFTKSYSSEDYFHIQSASHPYISSPYRAESYAIEFLRQGSIIMNNGLKDILICAPAIICLSPSVIRSFTKNSTTIVIDIIFFKPKFFLKDQANIFFLKQFDFFENRNQHIFDLETKKDATFYQLFNSINNVINSDKLHKPSLLRSYLYLLIFELDSLKKSEVVANNDNPIFEKFKELVDKQFIKEHSAQYYANHLNITTKYLTAVIKKNSGRTAKDWIDENIILEAKVLLKNKTLTINQISNFLNFSNQSVFGKFFKNLVGLSPLDFRKAN